MKRTVAVALACLLAVPSVITASPATFAQSHQPARSSPVAAPVFSFPVNGTAYPSNGPYVFQVQPVSGATGYLWSFVQGGVIVYQNLAWDGHLSPASYTVSPSSEPHKLIQPGDLHVWVRALMKSSTWTATGSVLVRIQGRGRSHPTATPQPKATAAPQATATPAHPAPGTVLYTADPTQLYGDPSWKHSNGMLVNDGTNSSGSTIVLPYHIPVTDYALEAEIQVVAPLPNGSGLYPGDAFGLRTRMNKETSGYWVEIAQGTALQLGGTNGPTGQIGGSGYTPDTNWHTYRVEVQGNDIRVLVDGSPIIDEHDNHYLTGDEAGIFDGSVQINVRAIRIIAL